MPRFSHNGKKDLSDSCSSSVIAPQTGSNRSRRLRREAWQASHSLSPHPIALTTPCSRSALPLVGAGHRFPEHFRIAFALIAAIDVVNQQNVDMVRAKAVQAVL